MREAPSLFVAHTTNCTVTDTDRSRLRSQLKNRRRKLGADDRRLASEELDRLTANTRFFKAAKNIAFYLPIGGEMDLRPLMFRAMAKRKTVFLPVVTDKNKRRMVFVRYESDKDLINSAYGIPEPRPKTPKIIDPALLDLVFTPLVAFDAFGNRLGMGAGFYDHAFHFLRRRRSWTKPKLVGAGYEFQQVRRIDAESHDVPLWRVVTEKRIYVPDKNT